MILVVTAGIWLIGLAAAWARRRVGSEVWRDWAAAGVIGVATAGFFWRVLFGSVWMPAGGGDLGQFLFPTYTFAAEWWRQGVIPLWNPYLFGGAPFVGDNQSGIFYPINLLTFFLSSPLTYRDMEFLSMLHFFIAGVGMYAFLRWGRLAQSAGGAPDTGPQEPSLHRAACLAGAVAFEFSDLFITHFGNLNLIAVVAWMPVVLLFYRRAVLDHRASLAALAGVSLAIAFLAGHIQAFLFILIALLLFAIWGTVERGRPRSGGATRLAALRDTSETAQVIIPLAPPTALVPEAKSKIPVALRRGPSEGAGEGLVAWSKISRRLAAQNDNVRDHPLVLLAVTGLVAFGLSAPALLPSIEMTQYTLRTSYSYEQAAQFSLPPAQLIGLFAPAFFGRAPQDAWGPWPRVEVGYIGVLPLVLAFLGLILRREAAARWLGLFALVGLALALGGYAIAQGWLYQWVPGFGQLRAASRYIVLFDFAIAALAALGFDFLLHKIPAETEMTFRRIVRAAPLVWLLITLSVGSTAYAILILGTNQDAVLFARVGTAVNALVFFLLMLALSVALIVERNVRFFSNAAWAALALALIFFDLLSLGAYVDLSTDDPSQVFNHPAAVAFLKSNTGLSRIDARGTGVDRTWPADGSIVHDLFDVNGDNPLVLADFDRYWQTLGSRSTPLYNLLNVKYLIGRKNVPLDASKFKLVFDDDPAFSIFENVQALPRTFIVHNTRVVPDQNAAFAALHAADFNPEQTVVLEKATTVEGASAVNSQPSAVPDKANIVGYGPNEIDLEVDSVGNSIIFLSEVYYPGWQAWVDEKETSILRADALFRSVELPAGAHRVRLLYDPWSFKMGVGIFAAALLVLAAWGIRSIKK